MQVLIGEIHPFPNAKCDNEQAAKILEEAAEVFCAWQDYDYALNKAVMFDWEHGTAKKCDRACRNLLDECADLIMACFNLRAGCVATYQNPYMKNRALMSVDQMPLEKHCVRGVLRAASLVDSATDSYVGACREYGAESEQTYAAIDRLLSLLFACLSVTCSLIAAFGVGDFTEYMEACEKRNRERGRYEHHSD